MLMYKLGIWFYVFAIRLVSPFNPKAKAFLMGRKNAFQSIQDYKSKENRSILWFHAASLGEFEQGLPVMERFKSTFPNYAIAISFFSPSGYESRKDHPVADFTCYLPVDGQKNASTFIETLTPKAAFFIKYEFWYYYLKASHNAGIPVYSLSARFTPKHIFFKPRAKFQRSILSLISHFFVQTEQSQELLNSIGISSSMITGDTRFDRVQQTVAQPKAFEKIAAFKEGKKLLIVGSAWSSDMEVISEFINTSEKLKVIIAPHEVDKKHVDLIVKHLKKPFDLYTQEGEYKSNILILNTIGMLSDVYQYGDFAYIGGAMESGLHNILEAVAFGLPVVYGHKGLDKFPEAKELAEKKGAIIISNQKEATRALSNFLNDPIRKEASQKCLNYIKEKSGATDRIMAYFESSDL